MSWKCDRYLGDTRHPDASPEWRYMHETKFNYFVESMVSMVLSGHYETEDLEPAVEVAIKIIEAKRHEMRLKKALYEKPRGGAS